MAECTNALQSRTVSRGGPGEIKSPVTSEQMGRKLIPAIQVRNTIKGMVSSGAITGAKADAWKQRIADEEEVAQLRQLAEGGDADAMESLAVHYGSGSKGLAKDLKQAFAWYKRAADLGNGGGFNGCGRMYVNGLGVDKNTSTGLIMIGRAVQLDVEHAHYCLGVWHKCGAHGFPKDMQEASRWFTRMLSAAYRNSPDSCREDAKRHLCEHPLAQS